MTDFNEVDVEPMIIRLYEQVKPLYQQLHAYVRRRLMEVCRNNGMDPHGPIPAHLLGMRFQCIIQQFSPPQPSLPIVVIVIINKLL